MFQIELLEIEKRVDKGYLSTSGMDILLNGKYE